MKIRIIKERRKTICLKLIDEDTAVLKVPKRLSDKDIAKFLEGKKKWLAQKSNKLMADRLFSQNFDLENFAYLFGNMVGSFKEIIFGFGQMTQGQKKLAIKKFYLSRFGKLEEISRQLSAETGFSYAEVKPTDSARVWGSYSSSRVMKLNWRLLILPENLVKYVVYHELCHSRQMNHSPQFWKEVERFCPNYKELKKELNRFAFLLKAC